MSHHNFADRDRAFRWLHRYLVCGALKRARLAISVPTRFFYLETGPGGGFTAGPLLLPGNPGTFATSRLRPSSGLTAEPVVSLGGFTAGPLLPPGLPGMPAPEFGPPGCSWGIRVSCAAPGVVNRNGKTVMVAVTRIVISYGRAQQSNGVPRLTFPSPKNLMGLSQKAELRCNSRTSFANHLLTALAPAA